MSKDCHKCHISHNNSNHAPTLVNNTHDITTQTISQIIQTKSLVGK